MILSIVLTLICIINKTVRLKINFVQEMDFTFTVSCFYFCGRKQTVRETVVPTLRQTVHYVTNFVIFSTSLLYRSPARSCPNMGASFCPAANQVTGSVRPRDGMGPGQAWGFSEGSNRLAGNKGHRQTERVEVVRNSNDKKDDESQTSWEQTGGEC